MNKTTENDLMKAIINAEHDIREAVSNTKIQDKGIAAYNRLHDSLLDEDREFLMLDITLDDDLVNHLIKYVLYYALGGKSSEDVKDIHSLLEERDIKDYIMDLIDEFLVSLKDQDFFKKSINIYFSKNPNARFDSEAKYKEKTITSVFSKDQENHIKIPKDSFYHYNDKDKYGSIKQRSDDSENSKLWKHFPPYEKTDRNINTQITDILNHIRTLYCNFFVLKELIELFPPIFRFIVKLGSEAPYSLQFSNFTIYPIGSLSNLDVLKQKREKRFEDEWQNMKLSHQDEVYKDSNGDWVFADGTKAIKEITPNKLYTRSDQKALNPKDKRNNLSLQDLSRNPEDVIPKPIILPYTQKGSLEQKIRTIQPSEVSPSKPIDIDQKLTGKFLSHWKLK